MKLPFYDTVVLFATSIKNSNFYFKYHRFYGVSQDSWAELGPLFLTKMTEMPPKCCRTWTSWITKALASLDT